MFPFDVILFTLCLLHYAALVLPASEGCYSQRRSVLPARDCRPAGIIRCKQLGAARSICRSSLQSPVVSHAVALLSVHTCICRSRQSMVTTTPRSTSLASWSTRDCYLRGVCEMCTQHIQLCVYILLESTYPFSL